MQIVGHGGKSILFVMAVDAEYGSQLKKRFTPLFTGVGPVEAGVKTANALSRLDAANNRPDLVVSLGSAGSRVLEQTEIYQASSVDYRDMDASPLGFEKGLTPFLDLPARLELPLRVPNIPAARLSTGANIVTGAAYDPIEAEMVDMESYACLRAAMMHQIPMIALRGISDGADELHHIDGWTEYLHIIDEKLALAVDEIFKAIDLGMMEI
jgi:adenosylhomocysteine nucleosidase